MAIPDFQTLMLPLVELASDGNEWSMQDAQDHLARKFAVSEEEQSTLLPSGRPPIFSNRVAWAKSYLTPAGVLESPRRDVFRLSALGRKVLREKPQKITVRYLERCPEFVEFQEPSVEAGREFRLSAA